MSYFERAKAWLSGDDVDIEVLESTIERFVIELKKAKSKEHKLDLEKTLALLNEYCAQGTIEEDVISSQKEKSIVNIVFDSSSLLDQEKCEPISLTNEERKLRLSELRNTGLFVNSMSELKRERKYIDPIGGL